jgi:exodeoxyribonuclease VIII
MSEIIFDLPAEEYHDHPALNFSRAKLLLLSPWHYKKAEEAPPRDETIDMRLGQLVHGYVLENRMPTYVVRPEFNAEGDAWHGNKKWCKEWKRKCENADILMLSPKESQREIRMCNEIAASEDARKYLMAAPAREVSIFTNFNGLSVKARLDAVCIDQQNPAVLDLKKTRDASPRGWGKALAENRYLLQAEWYRRVLQIALGSPYPPAWRWLVVEDSDAAPVQIYKHSEAQLEIGAALIRRVLQRYRDCMASGIWPAYGTGELQAITPHWAIEEVAR